MGGRSNIPEFGNWDSEENYTVYFDKARKGKGRGTNSLDPNDTQGNSNGFSEEMPPVNASPLRTSTEPAVGHRTNLPLRRDTVDRKPVSELPHHQHGDRGINSGEPPPRRGSRTNVGSDHSIEQAPGNWDSEDNASPLRTSSEPAVGHRTNLPLHRDTVDRKPVSELPHQQHGDRGINSGEPPPRRGSRTNVGSDRSIEQAPGRSKLRSVPRGDENWTQGAAVPRFGDWDENNPSSADGYTGIFNKVREERQTGAEKVPLTPTKKSYPNEQNQDNRRDCESTSWFCLSWCKK